MRKITLLFILILSWMLPGITTAQVQDFENTAVGDIPTGWVKYQSQSDDPGFAVSDQSGLANSGTHFLAHFATDIASESTSWVVSSAFTVGTLYEMNFYWRGKWSFSYNFSGVYISNTSNDPVANPNDFTLLEEFSPNNYPNTWLQWNKASYDLTQYQGQTIYVAFKYVGDNAHDFYIDDVNVAPMPYCEVPSNLDVSRNMNDYTALDVSWTPVLGVDTYEVVWGAPGFDPNASGVSSAQVTGSSYTITGLQESTQYEVYIRSLCSSYNMSSWEGPAAGTTAGPPPANNDCANAEILTVYPVGGAAGNEVQGDTTNATDSGNHPTCDNTGTNYDLWYTFTMPANETRIKVITGGANGSNIEAALYDSCGGTEMDCQGNSSEKTFANLTPGQTYILQVWHDDFNAGAFDIVLELLPPPPANDLCSGAIDLTVYPSGGGAGNEIPADTSDASDSGNHPTCDDFGTNLDLWYTFTAPAGGSVLVKTGGAEGSSIEAALYDTCGGTEFDCQGNGPSKFFSGLTPGQTYTLQIWHDDFNAGAFDIVVEEAPTAPANDECDAAYQVTVNIDGTCTQVTHGTTAFATASPQPDDVTGTPDNDVWFTFTAANDTQMISLLNVTPVVGTSTDMGMGLYDGSAGCSALTFVDDSDPNSMTVSGLVVGNVYYLRVYGWSSGPGAQAEFDVCVKNPPPPPANDLCADAIALTVQPQSCSSPTIGYNNGATDSGETAPSCANYSGGDLWYSVTVPSTGSVTVETSSAGGFSDSGLAVYSGSCGSLTEIECDDDDGPGLFSKIELSGQTPGDILYVRVWEYGNNSFGDFGICAYDPNASAIAENEIKGLKYYPNPVNNHLNISTEENIDNISVYDISGKKIYEFEPEQNNLTVDFSHWKKGIYFVKLEVNNVLSAFKIVKQ